MNNWMQLVQWFFIVLFIVFAEAATTLHNIALIFFHYANVTGFSMFIQYNLFFLAAEDHKAKERANTEAGELKVLMNLESVAVFPILLQHYYRQSKWMDRTHASPPWLQYYTFLIPRSVWRMIMRMQVAQASVMSSSVINKNISTAQTQTYTNV